jgi:hypothetical protein
VKVVNLLVQTLNINAARVRNMSHSFVLKLITLQWDRNFIITFILFIYYIVKVLFLPRNIWLIFLSISQYKLAKILKKA